MENTDIPVPVPSFWFGHSSQSLYKTHVVSSDLPQTALVQYLDDTLLVAESPEALRAHLRKELGFLLKKKCVWTPTQRIEFLGFEMVSKTMHLNLPSKKLEKIRKECKSVQSP